MTPNHGHDPTDPRRQQAPSPGQPRPPGQAPPPRQPSQPAGQQPTGQPPVQQGPAHPPGQVPGGQTGVGGAPPGVAPQAPQAPAQGGVHPTGAAAPGPQPAPRGTQRPAPTGRPLLAPTPLEDIVTENVVTAQRDTPVRTAVAMMAENDVGSVVVVEDDQPVDILTDRKVALALEDTPDVAQRQVDDLIGDDAITADQSMTVFDALQVMSDRGIRRLPVVDENGTLQGIVTLDDAIVFLGGELGQVAQTIEAQVPTL